MTWFMELWGRPPQGYGRDLNAYLGEMFFFFFLRCSLGAPREYHLVSFINSTVWGESLVWGFGVVAGTFLNPQVGGFRLGAHGPGMMI